MHRTAFEMPVIQTAMGLAILHRFAFEMIVIQTVMGVANLHRSAFEMTVIQTVMGDCQFILVFFRLLLLWIQLWSLPVAEILFSNVLLQCAAVESANLCIFGCATISAGSCQFTSACSWIWWVAFGCCMTDVFRVRLWARI